MGTFRDKAHAVEVIGGFLQLMAQGTGEQALLAGSGALMAYTLTDPDLRIVIDASVEPKPGQAFNVYIDDPKAPEPHVEFFLSADTYDQLYKGEAQPMALMMTGKVKAKGDVTEAMRLMPSMARAVQHYKKWRELKG